MHKLAFDPSNTMAYVKFFLDTNALIYLSGLKDSDLRDFKNRIEVSNSELSTTHVQVDEIAKHIKFHEPVKEKYGKEVQSYQEKIDKALESLKNKGINVHLEPSKILVLGVSRLGYCKLGDEETGKLYRELRKEIDACQKAKGKPKPPLNIYRDATIAVSSLGHDFLITTDECLFVSWIKVIGKYQMLGQRFNVPTIVCARRSPELVAKQILGFLS